MVWTRPAFLPGVRGQGRIAVVLSAPGHLVREDHQGLRHRKSRCPSGPVAKTGLKSRHHEHERRISQSMVTEAVGLDPLAQESQSFPVPCDEPSVTKKYLRVSLKAAGLFGTSFGGSSGAAKGLIYITAIQPVVNGSAGKDQLHDARPVSWPPNKTFDPRHIPRGITMFANVVTMREGHLDWNFQVPNQYGLNSVRSHAGTSRFRIAAIAENAKPVSIAIDASIKADKSGFQTRLVKR